MKPLLVKCPSVQWQPDGLKIHTKQWFLGGGSLGAPPISLIMYSCVRDSCHACGCLPVHGFASFGLDSLWGSCVTIGTIQRQIAWPLRKDDTHTSRSVNNCCIFQVALPVTHILHRRCTAWDTLPVLRALRSLALCCVMLCCVGVYYIS